MNNKNIAKFAIPVLLLVSLTECTTVLNSTAYAEFHNATQTVSVPKTFGIIELVSDIKFNRTIPTIVETEPWLNPKNKNKEISGQDLEKLLIDTGFSGYGLRMAMSIVYEESKMKIYSHNTNSNTGDNSYGLFQINMINSLGSARRSQYNLDKNEDLFDPAINARVAFEISNGGKSWTAWSTYKAAKSRLN